MEIKVAGKKSKIEVSDEVFNRDFSEALVHQVVTAYLAGGRAGTKAQKSRSDVSGGGKKPFKQKGTGRARAGTIRSPIWVGGGKTFAATPRDHSQKVNKKMYRAGMKSILSELTRTERLVFVNSIDIKDAKTKDAVKFLAKHDMKSGTIVVDELDSNVLLATRNIPNVYVTDVKSLDPVSLVSSEKVVMTMAAAEKVQEWLA
ncbi:MAG TPA: 50S ribosomal protein L4 [Gammaproteobacteria bacterium]|nr:50S ribosomal protein L4 [Xanthomonadales bacterium]HOP22379.1 50S ribosomal protein L4 [Gammaproteobacteria bacterium]MCB1594783.1 50S ribosomal protein L4 [Xanthomonadales bacterium]MCB1604926.1 50S ribosomal protein L4 [Xanthomonadales bacterium]HPI95556.1 50S ribosomal protein L4 [Gammaproteobacteria bacterium]